MWRPFLPLNLLLFSFILFSSFSLSHFSFTLSLSLSRSLSQSPTAKSTAPLHRAPSMAEISWGDFTPSAFFTRDERSPAALSLLSPSPSASVRDDVSVMGGGSGGSGLRSFSSVPSVPAGVPTFLLRYSPSSASASTSSAASTATPSSSTSTDQSDLRHCASLPTVTSSSDDEASATLVLSNIRTSGGTGENLTLPPVAAAAHLISRHASLSQIRPISSVGGEGGEGGGGGGGAGGSARSSLDSLILPSIKHVLSRSNSQEFGGSEVSFFGRGGGERGGGGGERDGSVSYHNGKSPAASPSASSTSSHVLFSTPSPSLSRSRGKVLLSGDNFEFSSPSAYLSFPSSAPATKPPIDRLHMPPLTQKATPSYSPNTNRRPHQPSQPSPLSVDLSPHLTLSPSLLQDAAVHLKNLKRSRADFEGEGGEEGPDRKRIKDEAETLSFMTAMQGGESVSAFPPFRREAGEREGFVHFPIHSNVSSESPSASVTMSSPKILSG